MGVKGIVKINMSFDKWFLHTEKSVRWHVLPYTLKGTVSGRLNV